MVLALDARKLLDAAPGNVGGVVFDMIGGNFAVIFFATSAATFFAIPESKLALCLTLLSAFPLILGCTTVPGVLGKRDGT